MQNYIIILSKKIDCPNFRLALSKKGKDLGFLLFNVSGLQNHPESCVAAQRMAPPDR